MTSTADGIEERCIFCVEPAKDEIFIAASCLQTCDLIRNVSIAYGEQAATAIQTIPSRQVKEKGLILEMKSRSFDHCPRKR